jgi:hypothetical protein
MKKQGLIDRDLLIVVTGVSECVANNCEQTFCPPAAMWSRKLQSLIRRNVITNWIVPFSCSSIEDSYINIGSEAVFLVFAK